MIARVDVQFATQDDATPAEGEIAEWVDRAMVAAGRHEHVEVSVRIVDVAEIQQLNRKFRAENKPTNVLSFPASDVDGLPPDVELALGDVVICAAIVRGEAERQGKSLPDHWAHILIHGTLHLLGFDHIDDSDAVRMEGLERQILSAHGIANPYEESLQET